MLNPKNWVKLYADFLLNYAYFRVRDKALAEDLMQDTFISALKSQHTYNGTANEKTWLTTILKNKIIDHYRSKSGKQSKITDSIDNSTNNDFFSTENSFHWAEKKQPKDWNNPEKIMERTEFNAILADTIQKMPEKLALVFTLKYIDDISTETICKELEITTSNYWVMIHRAKLLLRESLEKNWFKS